MKTSACPGERRRVSFRADMVKFVPLGLSAFPGATPPTCERRATAIFQDVCGFVAACLSEDEPDQWANAGALGRDLADYLLNCRR